MGLVVLAFRCVACCGDGVYMIQPVVGLEFVLFVVVVIVLGFPALVLMLWLIALF